MLDEEGPRRLVIGERTFDIATRPLVMGILNRTPDSFTERGRYFALDALLRRAQEIADQGADIFDVGGVKAGPGDEVTLDEELDRVIPAVRELTARFDIPVSVDTWRSAVAREAFGAGAAMGNDISGFADPGYLSVAARASAAVVATHIRLAPRVPDPAPRYDDVVADVIERLSSLARRAIGAGVAPDSIVIDAGLDLGKTASQSLELLRTSDRIAALGYPLLLSASGKKFLGDLLGLEVDDRGPASLAAAALGVMRGCRIVRVHDVLGTRRVCDTLCALAEARR